MCLLTSMLCTRMQHVQSTSLLWTVSCWQRAWKQFKLNDVQNSRMFLILWNQLFIKSKPSQEKQRLWWSTPRAYWRRIPSPPHCYLSLIRRKHYISFNQYPTKESSSLGSHIASSSNLLIDFHIFLGIHWKTPNQFCSSPLITSPLPAGAPTCSVANLKSCSLHQSEG